MPLAPLMPLAVGVLGPLVVSVGGRPVEVRAGRLRAVLAVLAMSAGRPVSVDRLTTSVWGPEPPDNPRRAAQTYLARLRGIVGDAIEAEPTGYTLRTDPDNVDALRFLRLLDLASAAPDPAAERDLLDEALGLWRGQPFDGVPSHWLVDNEAPRLTERYLAAVERRADLAMTGGGLAGLGVIASGPDQGARGPDGPTVEEPGELVAMLSGLTGRHPLRESLWVRLLAALDQAGRPAEALERYEAIRRRLADELGTDPGPDLQRVHADLLAGRAVALPAAAGAASPVGRLIPRQLPAGIDGFAGRTAALAALDRLLGDERAAPAVVISAIAGTAGVGKTALAVHWAHRIAGRFPDGQLYVNLRGFDPSGQALDPAQALRGFLDALGIPPQRIPSHLDAQIGLYRSLLAGRRMLVVLDNARDAGQVRPLLPGGPRCLVVVTSRNQLTSLVATGGARPLELDLLPRDEARELLARRLGERRIAADPAATDDIIDSCARLPLALAIAAARAATSPGYPLRALADQLRETPSTLDGLADGDPATDARTVFSWSYRALSPDAALLYRLLGLHPGPSTTAPAAASLAAVPAGKARRTLAELTRLHLLTEYAPGRFAFHDLLRVHAAELAHAHDPEDQRRAAGHRLLDHYLQVAFAAARLLHEQRRPITVPAAQPGVAPVAIADHGRAMDWFAAEYDVLRAAIDHAAGDGFDGHAWRLAWTMDDFFHRRGRWREWAAVQRVALAAADRTGDLVAQAHTHRALANACMWLGRHDEAHEHFRQALERYERLDDPIGLSRTHCNLAGLLEQEKRDADALDHALRALELSRGCGDRTGEATALNTAGWQYVALGRYESALSHCQRALAIYEEMGDRPGQTTTLHSLGYAHFHLGQHEPAVEVFQRALGLSREIGNRFIETEALIHMGDSMLALGDRAAARGAWQAALVILDELGHSDAAQVRAKLTGEGDEAGSVPGAGSVLGAGSP